MKLVKTKTKFSINKAAPFNPNLKIIEKFIFHSLVSWSPEALNIAEVQQVPVNRLIVTSHRIWSLIK